VLVFLDESGRLDSSDDIDNPTIAGIIVPERSMEEVARQLLQFKQELCPANVDPENYELKSSKLLRHSAGAWKIEFAERFFTSYLTSIEDLKVVAVVARRPSKLLPAQNVLLPLHHRWIISKVSNYIETNCPSDYAIFIYDSQGAESDSCLSTQFTQFLFKHKEGQEYLSSIVPTPFFGESSLICGIELADMVAGCLSRHRDEYLNQNRDRAPYFSRLNRYVKLIENKKAELSRKANDFEENAIRYVSERTMEKVLAHIERGMLLSEESSDDILSNE